MNGANPDDGFVEVIAREVAADPGNLALREDFVTLLLERDPDRAATELDAFEAHGGDPARIRLLRALLMAARLCDSNPPPPTETAAPPAAARFITAATVPSETGVPNNSANACAVRFLDRNSARPVEGPTLSGRGDGERDGGAAVGDLAEDVLLGGVDHPNHPALAREMHSYLRWRNANNRHPDVLAAQRRERARIRERHRRWGRPHPRAASPTR